MKFLIAFALFAVAFADVEPFRLREAPAPTIEGTVDYNPYVVEVVHSIAAQESSADVPSTANIVTVADFVKGKLNTNGGVKSFFDEAEPVYDRTVKFVDEAVNEVHVKESLKVVTSPLEEATPSDFAVKVVDEAVNEENVKESLVKVVKSPLQEATPSDFAVKVVDETVNEENVKESPLEEATLSDIHVNFVDEAENVLTDESVKDEESPKAVNFVDQAENVLTDESVKDEESPKAVNVVDEAENILTDESVKDEESPKAGPVNFVNEAANELTSDDAEIAPSFDSYAGIYNLIQAALEEKGVEGSSSVPVVSPEEKIPTAINVVENAVNMGKILAVQIEDFNEDFVDVHAKADVYYDHIPANVVRVAEFPRGKVFYNPMLR